MQYFLFLQGPHGNFFRELGKSLRAHGHEVYRVNLSGGDWYDWRDWRNFRTQKDNNNFCFRKKKHEWSSYISAFMQDKKITDLLVFGDWRSYHQEAIIIAKVLGIRVWAFEEGYMRPSYITMERDGVNGNSSLPKNFEDIELMYTELHDKKNVEPTQLPNKLSRRMLLAFNYSAFEILGRPFYPWYTTHRPNGILKELALWIRRLPRKKLRRKNAIQNMRTVYRSQKPYFLFPLQLDSDSQVRRYSPFGGMKEAITYVLASFATHAPQDSLLVIKNHPLDNGKIDYEKFIHYFAKACGIENRVFFVDTNKVQLLIEKSTALVLLNSTIGMSALKKELPVYCVGTSIYAMQGLAINKEQQSIADFWNNPIKPKQEHLEKFEPVLKAHALINGNFYSKEGVQFCVEKCCKKLMDTLI